MMSISSSIETIMSDSLGQYEEIARRKVLSQTIKGRCLLALKGHPAYLLPIIPQLTKAFFKITWWKFIIYTVVGWIMVTVGGVLFAVILPVSLSEIIVRAMVRAILAGTLISFLMVSGKLALKMLKAMD